MYTNALKVLRERGFVEWSSHNEAVSYTHLLCGERAKVCARLGTHSQPELREKVIRIINAASLEM